MTKTAQLRPNFYAFGYPRPPQSRFAQLWDLLHVGFSPSSKYSAESNVCISFQLVSSFQMEAQQKQTEADVARGKLSNVRKLIAKLLKSINEVRVDFLHISCHSIQGSSTGGHRHQRRSLLTQHLLVVSICSTLPDKHDNEQKTCHLQTLYPGHVIRLGQCFLVNFVQKQ